MDDEPFWLTFEDVCEIHEQQLDIFGGLRGVKDDNLIHSALASPQNVFHYDGQEDPLVLGVKLCIALAKNHGFLDGNKRTATASMIEFLALNGYDLLIPDSDSEMPLLGRWIEKGVTGALDEDELYERLIPFLHDRA